MFQISAKAMRILKTLNIIIILITIMSLIISYLIHTNKLSTKESFEKLNQSLGVTNKDAYQTARFIAGVGTGLGVGARILGLYATLQESLVHCLIYSSTLVVILLCYIIGVIRMSVFDVVLHIILVILAVIFAKLFSIEEPFSKEVTTLPL